MANIPTGWFIIGVFTTVVVLVLAVRIRTAPRPKGQVAQMQGEALAQNSQTVIESGIAPQTIAAIMAAIEAANQGQTLRFVAIRRAPTICTLWSNSGLNEIISNRQQYL